MHNQLIIAPLHPSDWPAVRAIYAQGLFTGNATFETGVPEWDAWNAAHLPGCRLVACLNDTIVGWAALSPYSQREVYTGVAEESIYIAEAARGHGVGTTLLRALVDQSERAGIWTLQAGIIAENSSSIALHTRCGFRQVGYRERIGRLNGTWHDVVLMERRSRVVGV
jgi:phosphinothricin acetyltransferase